MFSAANFASRAIAEDVATAKLVEGHGSYVLTTASTRPLTLSGIYGHDDEKKSRCPARVVGWRLSWRKTFNKEDVEEFA